MDADEARRAAFETWETMAPGWGRWREEIEETSTPVRDWMLREAGPKPGDTVLELAAGPGETGFVAAAHVGDGGRVISTDFSPTMVEIGRRRVEELGLANVEHRVMDAEQIELEDDSVDCVLCRWGYMLMPDPAGALAETRRVLRTGGRVALAVWTAGERNPWMTLVGRMLLRRGHVPPPDPAAPGMFALADEARLRRLLEDAGFALARVEEVPVRFVYDGLDHYLRRALDTGGVFAQVFQRTSEEERTAITEEMTDAFAPYATGGGYEFPGVALCASAT